MDGVNSGGKGRRMCVAGGCSRRKSDGVSLHQFPFDRPAILRQWTAFVHNSRKNWKLKNCNAQYVEIGLFKRGYLLLLEKQRKSLITVEKGHIQTTSFLGCPIVHFMNETDVVPLHRVLSYVPLVHHCGHSHCTIREGRTTIRVEQEDKDVYRRFVVHNMNHAVKVYVVNVYSLKCPSGISSADLKTCSKKL